MTSPESPDQILKRLERFEWKYPQTELEAVLAEPEAYRAELLVWLERAGQRPEELPQDTLIHRYAMLLLAQWREPAAFEPLMSWLALPSEIVDLVLGETLEHLLPRALASVALSSGAGRVEALMQAVENPELYDYSRIAALKAIKILMLQGELGRETLIAFYHKLFSRLPKRAEAFPWDILVREINEIHPAELEQDIRRIFSAGLVNPFFLREEHMEVDLSRHPEEHLESARLKAENRLIEDALAEIARFREFGAAEA